MYVQPISKDTVQSFVSGYEYCKKSDYLTRQISSHLKTKYFIEKPAMGYPYQIEIFSKKHSLSWVDGFVKITKEVLNKESEFGIEKTESESNSSQNINKSEFNNNKLTKQFFLEQVKFGKKVFKDIELENLNLRNEILSELTFLDCYISSDFRNSDLSNTKFIKCNVKTSDFRNSDLTNSLMENVAFESTKFKGAIIEKFIFKNNCCHSEEGIGQDEFNDWICETE